MFWNQHKDQSELLFLVIYLNLQFSQDYYYYYYNH